MAERFEPDFAWQEPTADNGPGSSKISANGPQTAAAAARVVSHGVAKTGFLIFHVDDRKLALDISSVEQVCPAVEITPLPSSPAAIVGLVNVHGSIVVVLNLRKKLGIAQREIELSDQLVIASADERQFALLVDEVTEVAMVLPDQILGGSNGESKSLLLNDWRVPIYDLANVLSEQEEEQLNEALYLAFLE